MDQPLSLRWKGFLHLRLGAWGDPPTSTIEQRRGVPEVLARWNQDCCGGAYVPTDIPDSSMLQAHLDHGDVLAFCPAKEPV
jgi:hypothetical protein